MLPALADNQQLSIKSQQAGQIGLLELIVVSRQSLDARRDLIDALADYQSTRIALELAARLAARRNPTMKNSKPHGSSASLVLTTLALALAGALTACGGGGEKSAEPSPPRRPLPLPRRHKEEGGLKLSAEEAQRAGIKLEKLAEQGFADSVTVTATIRPNQDRVARVAPRVEGRIVQVTAKLVTPSRPVRCWPSSTAWPWRSTVCLERARSAQRVAQADYARAESLAGRDHPATRTPARQVIAGDGKRRPPRSGGQVAPVGRHRVAHGRAASTFALTAPLAGTVVQKRPRSANWVLLRNRCSPWPTSRRSGSRPI